MKPRPTIYNGVPMRSRLEAGYAAWLDAHEFDWQYEPNAFATVDGQYLPDFLLSDVPTFDRASGALEPRKVYVEVKPPSFWGTWTTFDAPNLPPQIAKVEAQARIVLASEPDAIVAIASPAKGRQSAASPASFATWHPVRFGDRGDRLVPLDHIYAWHSIGRSESGASRLALMPPQLPDAFLPWANDYWEPRA